MNKWQKFLDHLVKNKMSYRRIMIFLIVTVFLVAFLFNIEFGCSSKEGTYFKFRPGIDISEKQIKVPEQIKK